jgi:hypothetical protein
MSRVLSLLGRCGRGGCGFEFAGDEHRGGDWVVGGVFAGAAEPVDRAVGGGDADLAWAENVEFGVGQAVRAGYPVGVSQDEAVLAGQGARYAQVGERSLERSEDQQPAVSLGVVQDRQASPLPAPGATGRPGGAGWQGCAGMRVKIWQRR